MRTFGYDDAERLVSVTYATDDTQVLFTYDNLQNVITRTERNGDVTVYTYDPLYRVIEEVRTPAEGNATPGWQHTNLFDSVNNRLLFGEFSASVLGSGRPGLLSSR